MPTRPTVDAQTLTTTETSIEIFELIEEWDGARMADLEDELSLSKSSVYAHLQTLRKCGLIVKENETYHVSLKLLWFAEHAKQRKPEYQFAEQKTRELAERTGEEVSFAVEQNNIPTVLHNMLPENATPTFRLGTTAYMHNTAVGKSMLAEYPDERIDQVIEMWGLPASASDTITTEEELRDEIETVRERGYALLEEEYIDGHEAAAKAVVSPSGRVVGALSVLVPTYRVSLDALKNRLVPKLRTVAAEFEAELQP
jgi:DNA-binding IclR family transcriptional regulator